MSDVVDHRPIEVLPGLEGRVLDADAHVMASRDRWPELYGPVAAHLLERFGPGTAAGDLYDADEVPPGDVAVWTVKGAAAPGAGDPAARVRTLDAMGVRTQLVFPDPLAWLALLEPGTASAEGRAHYNRWVGDVTRRHGDRLRPAAVLGARDVAGLVAEADEALAGGARALVLASARPPGARSPGDSALDPLWALAAGADVPVLLHLGGEAGFHAGGPWGPVPGIDLDLDDFVAGEPVSATLYATRHPAAELFLTLLVLGGVLSRHPTLRLGAMELGSSWVGPLLERLDEAAEVFADELAPVLDRRPSEQLQASLRVTPFRWEPVERSLARYDVGGMLCFSTDFPHREGGTDPITAFARHLVAARADAALVNAFFAGNAELVLPAP